MTDQDGGDGAEELWRRLEGLAPARSDAEEGVAVDAPAEPGPDTPAQPGPDEPAEPGPDDAGPTPRADADRAGLQPGSFRVAAPASTPSEGGAAPPISSQTAPPLATPAEPAAPPAQPPDPSPGVVPVVSPPPRPSRWRPKLRWLTVYFPVFLVGLVGAGLLYGWYTFGTIGRVDLEGSLATAEGSAQNILIVGSDSREGVDATTPNAASMGSEGVSGRRSDTLVLLRLDGDESSMMSIPRDLWVTNAATGREGRVNAAFNDGPANLVRTISGELGVPVHRYLEVDFVSFADIVDALGGVAITVPHTAFDRGSGLLVDQGTQTLDGPQALAYVRSRQYTEIIDGREVVDPTGDIGRQQRQQVFIRTVLAEAGSARNPLTLARLARAGSAGAQIDDEWGFFDMIRIGRQMAGADPRTVVLPTVPARRGNAAVLLVDEEAAGPVLAGYGAAD